MANQEADIPPELQFAYKNDSMTTPEMQKSQQGSSGRARWNNNKILETGGKRLKAVGSALQKVNLAKLIGDMEKDQELADSLEELNVATQEEAQRKEMVQEAIEAGMEVIRQHLYGFLENNPQGTYEEWIEELHPENAEEGKLIEGMSKTLDHRFYVEESDHRILWNDNLDLFLDDAAPRRQYVPAKTQKENKNTMSVHDMLTSTSKEGTARGDLIRFD